MKWRERNENESPIPGILFLLAAILTAFNIDFDDFDWLSIMPVLLFALAGIMWLLKFFEIRKEAKQDE